MKNTFRTAITIPERSWARFREVFNVFNSHLTATMKSLARLACKEICDEMEAAEGGLGTEVEEEGEVDDDQAGEAGAAAADAAAPVPAASEDAAPPPEAS